MAISKTQPMRSAEIELVDEVNSLQTDFDTISDSMDSLETTVGEHTTSIIEINSDIGELSSNIGQLNTTTGQLVNQMSIVNGVLSSLRVGYGSILLAAGATDTLLIPFDNAYDSDATVFAFTTPIFNEILIPPNNVTLGVPTANCLGIAVDVTNNSETSGYVGVGYMAIGESVD